MSEIDRLYRCKTLLSHRRALPRKDILAALEISPATFKRDIAKLRDRLGTPIVFDRDLGGYRLDTPQDATELPGFWFTQDEILALMTIQSMIEQLDPGLLGPKLKPLRKRLDDMLRFAPLRAGWVKHEIWHPQQQGLLHADGSYTLRVPYADERELVGDILRFGADVQVIAPAGLRQLVAAQAQKLLALYT